jgi:transposase
MEYYKNLELKSIVYADDFGNLNTERWIPISEFKGYEVSDLGRIKSFLQSKGVSLKILRQYKNNGGYLYSNLYKNKKSKSKTVHRLVALEFITNPENKPQVNHLKGNKTDNRVSELEWNTRSENELHAHLNGLKKSLKGINTISNKLTEQQVLEIRNIGRSISQRKIAEIYLVSHRTVCSILNRKLWKHI